MKKILIFGAGNTGIRAYEQNCKTANILAFLDNDEKKWGEQLKGIPIMQPNKENIDSFTFDYVVIASVYGKREIEEQLIECGIKREKIEYVQREPDVLTPFLKNLSEDFNNESVNGAVAEVGVFQGESAEKINRYFPTKVLHLFDTFTGFEKEDIKVEMENTFSDAKENQYNDTSVEMVMHRMAYPEQIVIHKGFFPDTAIGVTDNFCFVRIDLDLYAPTVAALDFFTPLMEHKGVILVHDYFGEHYKGVRKAILEYMSMNPNLYKIPIGDTMSIAIVGF